MKTRTTQKLFHRAKKEFVGPARMTNHLNTDFIGSLPPEIITKIPENKRAVATQQANIALSDFASEISNLARFDNLKTINRSDVPNKFEEIEQTLAKCLGQDKVKIEYTGHGAYKFCFRIKFGDTNNSYALQIFKDFYANKNNNSLAHGALSEPQNYFSVHKKHSHGCIARPFISKPVISSTSTCAYILTKFIDITHPIKHEPGPFSARRQPMISDDKNINNTINGIIIDTGGFIENPEHIADRKLYSRWHEFAQILDNIDFYSEPAFAVSRFLLKKYKELGILFFDTKLWPMILDETQPQFREKTRKMLCSLRKLHTKRNIMESSGLYEPIKNLLHKDFVQLFDFTVINQEMPIYKYDDKIQFYPELLCTILGTNNVPKLDDIALRCAFKEPMFFSRGTNRVHWNKYYTIEEVRECMKKHQYGIDWKNVLQDFKQNNLIKKFLQIIKIK